MKSRRGFTLTELLVVIVILLVLSALSFAVFGTGKSSDKMRSGARSAQSAFLGAKDRSQHAKDLRGVRLAHDSTNFNFVNGFVYLQPLPMQSVGNTGGSVPNDFSITRPGLTANPSYTDATQININGNEGQACFTQDSNGLWPSTTLQVQIPAGSGQWFQLAKQSSSAPYWVAQDKNNAGNFIMLLQTGYPGGQSSPNPAVGYYSYAAPFGTMGDANASMTIKLGNDILPFHQPITLPSGCIIDLYNSQIPTAWYTQQSTLPNNVPAGATVCGPDNTTAGNVISRNYSTQMDVMFSPRGNVTGTIAAMGAMFFLIRDIRDATNGLNPQSMADFGKMQGDMLILAVFPQTGLVQTYDLDMTDANGDGLADNVLNFAQRGMSAGK